jgi:hypothetical protein
LIPTAICSGKYISLSFYFYLPTRML